MRRCPICTTDYPDERKTCPTDGAMLLVNSDWSPGTLIRGKYRIIARLGRGGMGTVYKAEHIALEEVRALKVMAPTGDAEFVRRFRQEAQAARRLRHPNVVHVDDLDQADDGSFFIAMDYVDGVSLRQLLQLTKGPLPLMRTLRIVRSVAEALAAAHALGMVHRDIKPENILLARDPQGRDIPKVLDFGIEAMKENSSTQSTRYLLTPAQGSPEQWKGMRSSELDGRADLYALGVVWYEMLTGRLPLHAHTNEGWMRAHLYEVPEPPSKFDPELAQHPNLDALVLKLLAKDREQRPRDAHAVLGELNLIEARLSWNDPAVETPRIDGDATAMFRSPAKETGFQTPPPSQQGLAQPSFEAPSIAGTETFLIPGDTSAKSSIARNPAGSVITPPSRLLPRAALILLACAVVAAIVALGMIGRPPRKAVNPIVPPGPAQSLQSSTPAAALSSRPTAAETTARTKEVAPVQTPAAQARVNARLGASAQSAGGPISGIARDQTLPVPQATVEQDGVDEAPHVVRQMPDKSEEPSTILGKQHNEPEAAPRTPSPIEPSISAERDSVKTKTESMLVPPIPGDTAIFVKRFFVRCIHCGNHNQLSPRDFDGQISVDATGIRFEPADAKYEKFSFAAPFAQVVMVGDPTWFASHSTFMISFKNRSPVHFSTAVFDSGVQPVPTSDLIDSIRTAIVESKKR